MGFHKRLVTIDKIQHEFEDRGYEAVKNLIESPDAIVTCDDFSEKIVDAINNSASDEIEKSGLVSRLIEQSYIITKNHSDV